MEWDSKKSFRLFFAISFVATNSIVHTIKIVFVGRKIGVSYRDTLFTIIRSWRFSIVVLPTGLILYHFLQGNLVNGIVLFVMYILIVIAIFIKFPNFLKIIIIIDIINILNLNIYI